MTRTWAALAKKISADSQGLVRVDSMQQTKNKHVNSIKNIPFVSVHADQLRVEQVVIKERIGSDDDNDDD